MPFPCTCNSIVSNGGFFLLFLRTRFHRLFRGKLIWKFFEDSSSASLHLRDFYIKLLENFGMQFDRVIRGSGWLSWKRKRESEENCLVESEIEYIYIYLRLLVNRRLYKFLLQKWNEIILFKFRFFSSRLEKFIQIFTKPDILRESIFNSDEIFVSSTSFFLRSFSPTRLFHLYIRKQEIF